MKIKSRLYITIVKILSQHKKWLDIRHMFTLAWMVVGVIRSEKISMTAWIPYVEGKAQYAQSTQRRFNRWLKNDRINVSELYAPLIQGALLDWGDHTLYLALDTSRLFEDYCLIRISVVFRGRAVPLVWKVIEHKSNTVAFDVYKGLLESASRLLPTGVKVVLLADRGFADTDLMKQAKELGWHYRIRIKSNFRVFYKGQWHSVEALASHLQPGEFMFLNDVYLTGQEYGPVHLALGCSPDGKEKWYVVSDETVSYETFKEYGLRFDIEENFLDDKSNGFQLEDSKIRSAKELERLCMVLAVATIYLVSQGVEVVRKDKRRYVDPHWFRGSSYLKIGWNWVKMSLTKGWRLISRLCLIGGNDPEPAIASTASAKTRLPVLGSVYLDTS
ncbi:MAG: transposase [Candidatus Latescibacteria bacterium]|nr:transposase [Candidatus Latescibacterota bacterium]